MVLFLLKECFTWHFYTNQNTFFSNISYWEKRCVNVWYINHFSLYFIDHENNFSRTEIFWPHIKPLFLSRLSLTSAQDKRDRKKKTLKTLLKACFDNEVLKQEELFCTQYTRKGGDRKFACHFMRGPFLMCHFFNLVFFIPCVRNKTAYIPPDTLRTIKVPSWAHSTHIWTHFIHITHILGTMDAVTNLAGIGAP